MKPGQPFQLRTDTIIQLLGNPEFYRSCVAYLFLRDQGLKAVEQYHLAITSKQEGCGGCNQPHKNEYAYTNGVVAAFIRISRDLQAVDPKHLHPVRDFVRQQLGYQPEKILLVYKESGKTLTLEF